jgi:hypothetical protein
MIGYRPKPEIVFNTCSRCRANSFYRYKIPGRKGKVCFACMRQWYRKPRGWK